MSERDMTKSDGFHAEEKDENKDYHFDEIDETDEDYYLDDEIDEDDEDYFFDEEEEPEEDEYEEPVKTKGTKKGMNSNHRAPDQRQQKAPNVIPVDTKVKKKGPTKKEHFVEETDFAEDLDDLFPDEEPKKHKSRRRKGGQKKSSKKIWIISGSIVAALVLVYVGVSVFFMSHFYINTEINGKDFSAKTASDVEDYLKAQVKGYKLTVQEKDNKSDTIDGTDIGLTYKENDDIEKALKKQNGFAWPTAFFSKNSSKVTIEVSYNEDELNNAISSLQAVTAEQVPAKSAYPKFDGEKYVIEPEVIGTAVNVDVLKEKVHQHINEFQKELDMEKEGCYSEPKYTSDSEEVKKACGELNKFASASITYTMTENVVVDKALISQWLTVDDNMKVTFNEDAVKGWLTEFGDKYDTVGTTRTITTPTGKTTEVSGGTYGWSIDEDTEFEALVNSIKNGETVTKEPAYYQTAAAHAPQDWGNTYAEVDLSAQHMWYIVDGNVAMESDVVTGLPTPEKETTAGVFSILEMQRDKTLVGDIDPDTGKPEYETPVTFWMRITWSGIGFHDANWQPGFGGDLYTSIGSHGCVNMPYGQAETLYSMLSVGTPVIVHY
ncbi:MAG: L,D-transpeptidase/peptidoglycan binding protein [Faecalicatena sp.]|uniref:L,D-transpeptidase family protein n=1 Tax=Faecalicatena sp. TaxID=2005360 RepID=UPI0025837A08|nr:L,D-transpeptidase family protein [Faecalicatena sp.]MCI6466456.1 L,D-transpeptidase/peptidoglycan binding protein [Faecalicatena sp.]MDY5618419.1 peptidoglycan binding domain-containing protein [Lachnospiraceae bacterium]